MTRIINGKLVDGKFNPVRPEFGNIEHIKALKKAIFTSESIKLYIEAEHSEINCSTSFECECNKVIYIEKSFDAERSDDAIDAFMNFYDGTNKICRNCNRNYELEIDENDDLTATLKP